MKMKELRISQQFREQLEARYNPNNAIYREGKWVIPVANPLCKMYAECTQCPFEDCVLWIQDLVKDTMIVFAITEDVIYWYEEDNRRARNQLRRFWRKLDKAITWI